MLMHKKRLLIRETLKIQHSPTGTHEAILTEYNKKATQASLFNHEASTIFAHFPRNRRGEVEGFLGSISAPMPRCLQCPLADLVSICHSRAAAVASKARVLEQGECWPRKPSTAKSRFAIFAGKINDLVNAQKIKKS
jgi:hypothetical protein